MARSKRKQVRLVFVGYQLNDKKHYGVLCIDQMYENIGMVTTIDWKADDAPKTIAFMKLADDKSQIKMEQFDYDNLITFTKDLSNLPSSDEYKAMFGFVQKGFAEYDIKICKLQDLINNMGAIKQREAA